MRLKDSTPNVLILSNPNALKKFIVLERRLTLEKMTNQELRSLIIGGEKISRLKKSQLIDIILENYNKREQDSTVDKVDSVNLDKIKSLDMLEKNLKDFNT